MNYNVIIIFTFICFYFHACNKIAELQKLLPELSMNSKKAAFANFSINGTDSKLDKNCKSMRFEQVQMLLITYLGFQW